MGIKQLILDWFGYRIITDEEYSNIKREANVKALLWKTLAKEAANQITERLRIERVDIPLVLAIDEAEVAEMTIEQHQAATQAALMKNCERFGSHQLKLFLISQQDESYGNYVSAVVAAPSSDYARRMHPRTGKIIDDWSVKDTLMSGWVTSPDLVTVRYLGEADSDIRQGVICLDYNEG